ncbi:unnamed protein product [Heligmosomoides polygyrus]|uniref:DUF7083 domain-containing protein n=1 Tax=Heligmosomoides polygyrus TaxID=6339 RepID=A0A183GIM3_HELPZ|nr:unnamed protein product [Heligmosomoides polygyrus]
MPTMTLLTTLTMHSGVPQLHSQQSITPTFEPLRHFDLIAGRIAQFYYESEANLTFEAWFRRHEYIFQVDEQTLRNAAHVRLLLHKLDASAYEKNSSCILPKTHETAT